MKISDELIRKFLDDACTAEEAMQVCDYLDNNPAALSYYIDADEWNNVDTSQEMPAAFWNELWNTIDQQKQQPSRIISLRTIAIAASIAAVICMGYITLFHKTLQAGNRVAYTHRVIKNITDHDTTVTLQDHSVVTLAALSELNFDEPFQNSRRSVYLKGAASFKVAKDKTKPFTVYSNEIATTALGTQFRVTSYTSSNTIKVHLTEGKVVIKPTDQQRKKLDKDYYLLPGDLLTYDRMTKVASVNKAVNNTVAKQSPQVKKPAGAAWYVFRKESLATVLNELAHIYSTPIQYYNTDVKNMYFIGRFEKSDSLEKILKTICKLNGLKVEQKNGMFLISK